MRKSDRDIILQKTNRRCCYCGDSLEGVRWHADHIKAVQRVSKFENGKFIPTGKMLKPENDNIENMMASCPQCNILKSCQTIEMFRETVANRITQLERIPAYRTAIRYGLITEVKKPIVFYFETIKT